jgi:hypothetical protein
MPISFNVNDEQMQMMKMMMSNGEGVTFVRAKDEAKETKSRKLIATVTDSKGNQWIARAGEKKLNDAQIDMARQILEWMALRAK